ncbi:MAG: GlsB/YeaQ/YmgE family stress response membrane protein [Candidatus Acidiferrales bacterium]
MILSPWIVLLADRVYFVGVSSRGLISWIILGLIAGWIAGHLARGRGFGCIVDVILGLIGAVIGGWIFTRLGITAVGFLGSLAAATVGAILLVLIARLFAGGGSRE